jgi:hypothetical protein
MAKKDQAANQPVIGATIPTPKARHRSPNYPFISLEKAIERTKQVYDQDRRHAVPLKVACEQRWSYKPGGSQADQTIAALRAYGLIEVNGTGADRTVKVSDRAHRILLNAPDASERVKDAALAPPINAELWQKYGTEGLPTSEVIRHYLIFERHFNEDVVDSFIANFKDTISFAKLVSSDKMEGRVSVDDDGGRGDADKDNQMNHSIVPPHNKQEQPPPILPPGMRRAVYPGETGDITLLWPAVLTTADMEDIDVWLDMMKGKIKRSVKPGFAGGESQS